jgi:hypothetical protein
LDEQLQPLALPVLERGAPELRPELGHLEGLTVLTGVVADLDEHGDELADPRSGEEGEQQVCRPPTLEV